MSFCDKDGGQFRYSCWKRVASHLFGFGHEINNIEKSRRSSFNQLSG